MSDDIESVDLPDATVTGFAAYSGRAVDEKGQEHPLVYVLLQFQVTPGLVHRQAFIMHADSARELRATLKNPPTLPKQEETPDDA